MRPATIGAFIILVLLGLGPISTQAIHAQTKVLVGLTTINSRVTPLWIAEEKGFFAKNGLEVLLVATRVSTPAIAALIAGELQMVFGGASSALGAVSGGADLKVIASSSNRLTYDLVARPGLRKPEDLRGKSFGVGGIGGSLWMGAMLALDHFGLDASRDQISIRIIGDQTNNIQALEAGSIDAALLDGVFSYRLKQKGFPVIAELYNANIPFAGQGVVTARAFLQKQPAVAEGFLRGLLAGIDFCLAPGNKPAVLKTMTARLRITDTASAEMGYQDLVRGVEPKPYPSLEALRNVQRLMKAQNPKVANVKVEELVDDRILRKILGG
ncbi:MAG TPA: ABC transporter substrate-binding protein [Methylomirabilota bacterium]|nr:ABC transporter substrate-binding protein [Methylomirabilota bacterium]